MIPQVPTWTSTLSVNEFARLREAGFEPVGQVTERECEMYGSDRETDHFAEGSILGTAIARFREPTRTPGRSRSCLSHDT